MNRLVLYGGAFNPPHLGHVHCVKEVLKQLSPDLILLVPTSIAPHKTSDTFAGGEDRTAMLKLAFEAVPKTKIDTLELEKEGVSYTLDTVKLVRKKYNPKELVLLMGEDMFLSFETWHGYKELLQLCTLCVVPRIARQREKVEAQGKKLAALGGEIFLLQGDILQISSTQIRAAFQAGKATVQYLHPKVENYIKAHGLYM